MAEPNWQNRTLFGVDNLDILRGMDSGTVHLIATDPPFNKGKDFHATPDSLARGASFHDRWSWDRDIHEEWCDQIQDDRPKVWNVIQGSRNSYGDDMGAFLCYMAVRLIAMHRVLRDDGSMYLHCDPTASHYLKELLDAIFGRGNFRSEIIWKRTSAHNRAKRWGPVHDAILYYTKSSACTWNKVYQDQDPAYIARHYRHEDNKGKFSVDNLTGPGKRTGSTGKPWRDIDPAPRHWEPPPDSSIPKWFRFPKGWADMTAQERLDALDGQGLIYWPKGGSMPRYKRYLDANKGMPAQDVITDIGPVSTQSKERTGYPTQKPLALYERIILASSNEGDIVLDPFAGCATTCVAAEIHNRQWVGIDIWKGAKDVLMQRMEDTGLCSPKQDANGDQPSFTWDEFLYTKEAPVRTDDDGAAVPYLQTKEEYAEPAGKAMSRADMKEHLLKRKGCKCQGCDRPFDDPRYLELDHNTPRSDGGLNHISNRVLLCGPCNKLKSNVLTLSGLRKRNRQLGHMYSPQGG